MPIWSLRNPLLCFLLAAAVAGAQQRQPGAAQPAHAAMPRTVAHKARPSVPRSYRISIAFKRTYHGKLRSDKTYVLLATVCEILPAIRDDAHFRTDAASSSTIEGATDVDILALKPQGELITVALKISTQTIGTDAPDFLPKLPVAGTHQYLVSPTVPIGKRITVYSNIDALNNTTVEVELLIQPFDPGQPNAPEAQHQATSTNQVER
jgi:hypothetical protein